MTQTKYFFYSYMYRCKQVGNWGFGNGWCKTVAMGLFFPKAIFNKAKYEKSILEDPDISGASIIHFHEVDRETYELNTKRMEG